MAGAAALSQHADADDPDEANVYRDLQFPDGVYEHIREYHEERAQAAESHPAS